MSDKQLVKPTNDGGEEQTSGERKDRASGVVVIAVFLISLLYVFSDLPGLLSAFLFYDFNGPQTALLRSLGYVPLVLAGSILFAQYLRGENDIFDIFGSAVQRLRGGDANSMGKPSRAFRKELSNIDDRLTRLEVFRSEVDPSDDLFSTSITDKIKRLPYKDLVASLKDGLNKSIRFEQVPDFLSQIEENLREYKESNRRQLSTNLTFGVVGAGASIFVAGYLVVNSPASGSDVTIEGLLRHYIPWVALVLVIQFMSIFFLRLYSKNIETEKFLRNELTNVLTKKNSVLIALYMNDSEALKSIIENFNNVERNRFIEKGQSTVELEEKRIDQANYDKAFQAARDIFKSNGDKKG